MQEVKSRVLMLNIVVKVSPDEMKFDMSKTKNQSELSW